MRPQPNIPKPGLAGSAAKEAVLRRVEEKGEIEVSNRVKVSQLPKCDFCGDPARHDGKTILGPWADMCAKHFKLYGIGLGTGRGQELVLDDVPNILDVHDVDQESQQ